jgi:hypothetical protein
VLPVRALLRQSVAVVTLTLTPALAAAQSAFQTFTDRAAFRDALSTPSTIVNLRAASVSATDLGIVQVSTAGACMAAPSLVVAGGMQWIDFTNGSCGNGSLTFTFAPSDIGAFGFILGAPPSPGAPRRFDVTTSFDGAVGGASTVSYMIGRGLPDGFFGLFLDPGLSASAGLATVTVSTSSAARLALRDVEFAGVVAPEPATVTLLGAGLIALGAAVRRRRAHG